jgi:hypothetical protein
MWDQVFRLPEGEIPLHHCVQAETKKRFMAYQWFEVYHFVEWLLPRVNRFRGTSDRRTDPIPAQALNNYLEREMSGYRVVKQQLVPVTSPTEVAEIQKAATPKQGYDSVAAHINSALWLMSKKPDPDYRNSVKESVTAVEAAVNLLTGAGGIDEVVRVLEQRQQGTLHPVTA